MQQIFKGKRIRKPENLHKLLLVMIISSIIYIPFDFVRTVQFFVAK